MNAPFRLGSRRGRYSPLGERGQRSAPLEDLSTVIPRALLGCDRGRRSPPGPWGPILRESLVQTYTHSGGGTPFSARFHVEHATGRCRSPGHPEKRKPAGGPASDKAVRDDVPERGQPTATATHLQRLAELYGGRGE